MLKSINESFDRRFEESANVRQYSDMLFDMIEDGMVDAKAIAEDLIYWCSEDDIEHYMRVNDLLYDDIEEGIDLVSKQGTIANVLAKNMQELAEYPDANSLKSAVIKLIQDSEISDKKSVERFIHILNTKKSKEALLSTLATFMTGDKVFKPGRK